MLSSHIKITLRNLAKHRLYALINISGLALGITVFLFCSILVAYENNHDSMFSNRDRIFTVGSIFAPNSGEAVKEIDGIRTTYAPLFDLEIENTDQVARAIHFRHLLTVGNDSYYEGIRFADKAFTRIFDFRYLHGNPTAIDDPRGLIVTASTAEKLFGRKDVLGEIVTVDHKYDMHIAAVIEDVPADSHFHSTTSPTPGFTVVAPFEALVAINDFFKMEGNWDWYAAGINLTYILLSDNRNRDWLQNQVDSVYDKHTPKKERGFVSALKVRPLAEHSTWVWDALGLPVLESAQLLGLLILLIACVNYTNLATAQSFDRTREVGLRKTLGARREQLLAQFLVESLTITAFALILAVAGIELLIPVYNSWTGKNVALDYIGILPWLMLTAVTVGLLAGAYPAYLISRLSPIESLRKTPLKGRKGNALRSVMIGAQFSISIFILAMVMVIHFQNQKMQETGDTFPKSRIVILEEVGGEPIRKKHETLRRELETLAEVEAVTFSNSLPYDQSTWHLRVTPEQGDEAANFVIDMMSVDHHFMNAYGIELQAGRSFKRDVANDVFRQDRAQLNVVINRLAAERLGFLSAGGDAGSVLHKSFYRIPDDEHRQVRQYTVVGVMENVNFNGFFNEMKPMVFLINPDVHLFASIKISGRNINRTLGEIETVWKRVIVDYPIQYKFLDDIFSVMLGFFQRINGVLAAFAGVALSLALVGLFGLAAFMAQRRTREIGIRKVMGASKRQIARLLIWQFSLPVIWSLLLAAPMAYLVSDLYLNFFANRIDFVTPIIMLASITGILTAWIIVAGHAINIARAVPARSLRYE